MSAFEIFVAIYMAAVPPALGYLFWGRMNRLESRMDAFEVKVTSEFGVLRAELRQEFSDVRQEIAGLRGELGSEIGGLRGEMHQGFSDLRKEIAGFRSDITQVALAVGTRPRASEA